jgi:hypothetical protein
MGRREIFHNFSLMVEIEGHFSHEFVTYDYMAQDRTYKAFCIAFLKS